MRIYFAFPEARDALADKERLATLGTDPVIERPVAQPDESQLKADKVSDTNGTRKSLKAALKNNFSNPS
jgi:hypothetical protein